MNRIIRPLAMLGVFSLCVLALSSDTFAQTNGQGGNTGGFDPGTIDPSLFGNQGTTGNNTGSNSVTGQENLTGNVGDFAPPIPEISDDRYINGFVGRTKSRIEELGFVGPTQGGLESTSGAGGTGTGAGAGRTTGGGFNGFTGFGGTGATNGFSVSRSSVRARVVPNFQFRSVPSAVTANNFQQRIQRLPQLRSNSPQRIQVSIENTTATIRGTVSSQDEVDRVIGQLRMEPGVYRINNEVKVTATASVPTR